MTEYIFVFRSKTDVFNFYENLRERGIPVSTVGTPKEAGIGCGLAVKTGAQNYISAKSVLYALRPTSFYGVYQTIRRGERVSTSKIL